MTKEGIQGCKQYKTNSAGLNKMWINSAGPYKWNIQERESNFRNDWLKCIKQSPHNFLSANFGPTFLMWVQAFAKLQFYMLLDSNLKVLSIFQLPKPTPFGSQ